MPLLGHNWTTFIYDDRHVYGTPARREVSYDNVKVSGNAWDSNLIKVNPVSRPLLFFSVANLGTSLSYALVGE
jgi:hypothetical protein